ncbi:hypothetical protein N7492_002354 [Penicillium capsulatum]|uniref:C2H2-type domain-containing protein n=1 Tax=Penicillium capsulatum TaxID=69766 RepID=A0A9W9IHQ6_9EURO|nr:hypothetical protein N7492_002354 [Penicillium capsulatum]
MMDTSVSPMEVPTGATTLVSSMQSYYDYGLSQSQLQDAQGYDTDQIDRWCMESMLVQSMYSNPAPYPEMNPLSFSGTEMASSTDPLFEENLDVLAKQFLSFPQSADLPSSYPAGLTGDLSFTFDLSTPSSALSQYGIPAANDTWRCAHPGCTSQTHFRRGCDLRKHFNPHRNYLFCRHEDCTQYHRGGFSSKKDRARHEAKHSPGVVCDWDGCERVFSRVYNMKDHIRRIHLRRE